MKKLKNIRLYESFQNNEDNEFINELKSISPSAKILMYDPNSRIVVTSARFGDGMKPVCKIANAIYSITDNKSFRGYTSGRLQISIIQLGLPKTDDKYLTSLTINPLERITLSANRSLGVVHNKEEKYTDFLRRYGIGSQEIIDAIEKNWDSELAIKLLIEKIERGNFSNSPLSPGSGSIVDFISSAFDPPFKPYASSKPFTPREIKEILNTKLEKAMDEGEYRLADKLRELIDGDFFSTEDIKEFENITGGDYSREEILDILELTKKGIENLDFLSNPPAGLQDLVSPFTKEKASEIVADHPMILDYVQKNML